MNDINHKTFIKKSGINELNHIVIASRQKPYCATEASIIEN